jgi:hypothetical protein
VGRIAVSIGIAAAAAMGLASSAQAACALKQIASIPITFVNNTPMVEVSINGKPAHLRFTLSDHPSLWGSAVESFGLTTSRPPAGPVTAYGLGGKSEVMIASVRELKFSELSVSNIKMMIISGARLDGEDGQFSLLLTGVSMRSADVGIELDFPHGVVRLLMEEKCKGEQVVYWGGGYSVVGVDDYGHFPVKLNGHLVRGVLGPGDEVSIISPRGARFAGVDLRAAGHMPMGMLADQPVNPVEVSISTFSQFTVGDETIKNAALAIGDTSPNDNERSVNYEAVASVVLGSDFARSHRIYIARSQSKIYFSYVGGAVFSDIYRRLGIESPSAADSQPKN